MKPIRVLHVSQPTEAGVATVLLSYLSRSDPGLSQFVACPDNSALSDGVARLGGEHIGWESVRSPSQALRKEMRDLRTIVREVDPDVVHLHSSKAGLVGRLVVRGGRPTVFQPHAWSFSAVAGTNQALSLGWERVAQRWTHATVCVSEDERRRGVARGVLRQGRSGGQGTVLPNVIDPSHWPLADRAAARSRLGLSADAQLAVCVGRLCRQKGQDLLMKAWPLVTNALAQRSSSEQRPPQLVLVGDGPDRPGLERDAPPGARLVGTTDPHDWYAAANVVVVPSRWEAMAMVPLEAQTTGRWVVATDVDGMRERLHPDQSIVPAERPDLLAEAIVQALSDPVGAQRVEAGARMLAERQWSTHRTESRLCAVYVDAIATTREPIRA